MESSLIVSIILGVVGLPAGVIAGKFLFAKNTQKQVEEADQQAQTILSDPKTNAKTIKREKQLEAKEKLKQLKAKHDKEILQRNQKMAEAENRVRQKEQ